MYQKRNKELEIISLYLRDYNKHLYLREISRMARLPVKTTQNKVAKLEKDKLLLSVYRGKNKYFRLNLENIETKFRLTEAELYKTRQFLHKYPVFKTFLKELNTNNPLVVFGSFAKGNPLKDSDLDLLIINEEKKKIPYHLLPYKIHKIGLSKSAFGKIMNKQEVLFKEIEENHIILNNHSFFVDILWSCYARKTRLVLWN